MTVSERVLALRDEGNAAFLAKLIPTIPPETVLGARLPALRSLARELRGTEEAERFLSALPHRFHEENVLHALLLNERRDFELTLAELDRFLPHVDNWAACDALRPRCFVRHRAELIPAIRRWLDADWLYTRRFALEMLMTHYLDEDFEPVYLDWAAETCGEDYYLRMMQAWYFATALAKQYESTLPLLEQKRLEPWTHNKTIQKAIESLRVPDEHKAYLKTLRV